MPSKVAEYEISALRKDETTHAQLAERIITCDVLNSNPYLHKALFTQFIKKHKDSINNLIIKELTLTLTLTLNNDLALTVTGYFDMNDDDDLQYDYLLPLYSKESIKFLYFNILLKPHQLVEDRCTINAFAICWKDEWTHQFFERFFDDSY
jgi:hypothetical protein